MKTLIFLDGERTLVRLIELPIYSKMEATRKDVIPRYRIPEPKKYIENQREMLRLN